MDIEEPSAPYRGFLRSGSYPALTARLVSSSGVLLRAAGWFAVVVTAASAGYNMTQRLVSQAAAVQVPQTASTAPALAIAAQGVLPYAPPQEDQSQELVAVRMPADPRPVRPAEKVVKRKPIETGAVAARPTQTLPGEDVDDVASAHAERIADRVRDLNEDDGSDTDEPLTVKPPPAAVSGKVVTALAPKPLPAAPIAKPAVTPVPLAATAHIEKLAVNGSVSPANVRHGLERVEPSLAQCYRHAASQAGENHFSRVRVEVKIDEAGRVKTQPTVEGAQLPGLDACLSSAFKGLVCRAPDTGTARASITLSFGPLALNTMAATQRVQTR